jgi:coenzyme F420-reducing hydrogenase alpha subunit
MGVEGELLVQVESRFGRVTSARARPQRLRVGPRLFVGRPAQDAATLARALFSVCGRSQAIAARAAVESIGGVQVAEAELRARERAVAAEALQEHAWKVFVDAPRLLGEEAAIGVLVAERRAVTQLLDAVEPADIQAAACALRAWCTSSLFGRAPEEFLRMQDLAAIQAWTRDADTPASGICARVLAQDPALGGCQVPLLPHATSDWIAACLVPEIDAAERFEDLPALGGKAHETGPLARSARHPLVAAAMAAWGRGVGARFVARLVEMALLVDELGSDRARARHGARATGNGTGVGWTETARGLLVHRVALDGDRIAAYRIVAPTEWNFHPAGAFTHGVCGMEGQPGAIEEGVRRVVASLDPCVAVRYEARHA